MTEKQQILNHLIDKYEKSKHLLQPGISRRRVMLRTEHNELPEYNYEDSRIRDAYNLAAKELEEENLIELEWLQGRQVMMVIALNLESDSLLRAYRLVDRLHPRELAQKVTEMTSQALSQTHTPWISRWRDEICAEAEKTFRVPTCCRHDFALFQDLLIALKEYDAIPTDGITKRAFSIRCFQDSKYFERSVENEFLRVAVKMDDTLGERCLLETLSARDQLSYLGIYARAELYEMAGPCALFTDAGTIDYNSAEPYGLAIPGTLVSRIVGVDLSKVATITFIENKTNYDEYLLREKCQNELVVYQGGFLSPQQCRLVGKLVQDVSPDAKVFLWSDIDMGGFLMFEQLQSLIPKLKPLRMAAEDVERLHRYGLERKTPYLSSLKEALETHRFPLFEEAIRSILQYKVTIEQETFLLAEQIR